MIAACLGISTCCNPTTALVGIFKSTWGAESLLSTGEGTCCIFRYISKPYGDTSSMSFLQLGGTELQGLKTVSILCVWHEHNPLNRLINLSILSQLPPRTEPGNELAGAVLGFTAAEALTAGDGIYCMHDLSWQYLMLNVHAKRCLFFFFFPSLKDLKVTSQIFM